MWGYQRRKPITRVRNEIEYLKAKMECNAFAFADDCLTLNKRWFYGLLQELERLNLTWTCSSRIDTLDPDLIKAMKNAGCKSIYHGLESGSSRIRNDILNKKLPPHITNYNIVKVIEEEIRQDIKPTCSFMAGIPTETKEEMEETIQLGGELKKKGALTQFWIMTPFPDIKAVQIYQDKLIRLDRREITGQSDINGRGHLYLYHKFYHRYFDDNPDLQMFLPEMPLTDFFNLYLESKAKLEPSFRRRNSLGSYIKEKKSGKWLQMIRERIRLSSPESGSIGAHLLVSLEFPFFGLNEVAESVVEARPRHCLVSIKMDKTDGPTGLPDNILDFLIRLRKAQIPYSLTRPFPLLRNTGLVNWIKMPANCRECLELFRVGANDRIILCTGRQLFLEHYAESRLQIYGIFLELAQFEAGRRDLCVLFPDSGRVRILGNQQEKVNKYLGLAFQYYSDKEYPNAVEFLRKARRAGYTEWDADYLLGLSLENMGDDYTALRELRKAEKKNPCESDINLSIASCLKKVKDLDRLFIEAGKAAQKRNLSRALISKKVEEMTFRCLKARNVLPAAITNKDGMTDE
jgi:hypothetical protein